MHQDEQFGVLDPMIRYKFMHLWYTDMKFVSSK